LPLLTLFSLNPVMAAEQRAQFPALEGAEIAGAVRNPYGGRAQCIPGQAKELRCRRCRLGDAEARTSASESLY